MTWLCVALGLSFALAVVPVGSIELFLVGLVLHRPDIPWPALGAVVAVGQVAGKLVHFYAARAGVRLPGLLRHRVPTARANGRPGRVGSAMALTLDRARAHPRWLHAIFAASALLGLPPFAAVAVLAGVLKMRLAIFLTVGLLGRFIRYSIIAAVPTLVIGNPF